ncbi:MAG: ArsR/SmtB family transcription factor [Vicinamibacterales bacterium]
MKTRAPRFKTAIYRHIARIGQAVASPSRLALLDLLSQGPRTVEALARQAGQTVANTSHHLRALRSARLVDSEKAGLYVTYRLADSQVAAFFLHLRTLAEARLAEIERVSREYFEGGGAMDGVGQKELLRRVRAGEVTVLDVRPREEYIAGHIPGALSIPVTDLRKRLGELPKGRDIVAYCRGPYCVMAFDAVELLRRKGLRAHRMETGVNEWRARRWRIAAGDGIPAAARA